MIYLFKTIFWVAGVCQLYTIWCIWWHMATFIELGHGKTDHIEETYVPVVSASLHISNVLCRPFKGNSADILSNQDKRRAQGGSFNSLEKTLLSLAHKIQSLQWFTQSVTTVWIWPQVEYVSTRVKIWPWLVSCKEVELKSQYLQIIFQL